MVKTIYIDLDGTILNISEKYYRVYRDLGGKMTKEGYWDIKRTGKAVDIESPKRIEMLESKEYLKHDVLFAGVVGTLAMFPDLVLVTLRKNHTVLKAQLECLGIANLFSNVLTGEDKYHAIKPFLCNNLSVLVGDSVSDIQAAKALAIKSVAVTTGVRSLDILIQYYPDLVINSITELSSVLAGR